VKLLILGGTIFLGRHLVDAALARGHEVTLFNRGKHAPELYPEVEKLRGDRDGNLSALERRTWDAAIDTCGYVPRLVRASAERLSDSVGHYAFISSISVYADWSKPHMDESAPVGTLDDPTVEQVTGETYGPLKALCEQAAESALPGRALNVRAGLISGPYDGSHRFPYWPRRVARGGEVLAPGNPDAPVQLIDARDLAEWIVRMAEAGKAGVYNATGPGETLTMGQTLDECRRVTGSDVRFTWVPEETLLAAGVAPYTELPLWIPQSAGEPGHSTVDCRKAIAAGLTFRPLAETVRDTLAWDRTLPDDADRGAGMKPEREAELLAAHAQGGAR
jgi:2'-hydroxyisoflavone reductase